MPQYLQGWIADMRDDQRVVFGLDPSTMSQERLKQYVCEMGLALNSEVDELLREFTWKPWKSGWNDPDPRLVAGEVADIMHFVAHLCNVAGVTDLMVSEAMSAARQKNESRMRNRYAYEQ